MKQRTAVSSVKHQRYLAVRWAMKYYAFKAGIEGNKKVLDGLAHVLEILTIMCGKSNTEPEPEQDTRIVDGYLQEIRKLRYQIDLNFIPQDYEIQIEDLFGHAIEDVAILRSVMSKGQLPPDDLKKRLMGYLKLCKKIGKNNSAFGSSLVLLERAADLAEWDIKSLNQVSRFAKKPDVIEALVKDMLLEWQDTLDTIRVNFKDVEEVIKILAPPLQKFVSGMEGGVADPRKFETLESAQAFAKRMSVLLSSFQPILQDMVNRLSAAATAEAA